MRHPSDGTLRRLVDDPAGVPDTDRSHVAQCPRCQHHLGAARREAQLVRDALHPDPRLDVDDAWRRLTGAGTPDRVGPPRRRRRHPVLGRPVVAGAAAALLLVGGSAAAASNWLEIFRTEQVAPVSVTERDLVQLPELGGYGEVEVTSAPELREVASAAEAEQATGLAAPDVRDLPQGVVGDPAYRVLEPVRATFTFSAAAARRTAEAQGHDLPTPPAGLDGAQFRLEAGPGLAAVWSERRGVPALIVGEAVAPRAYSSGVSFETARDYLLSLPGLPPRLAAQLRAFSAGGTTLPLPIPRDAMTSTDVEVGGSAATLLQSRDDALAAVVWVRDGVVTVVAGSLTPDEVLDVAEDLT